MLYFFCLYWIQTAKLGLVMYQKVELECPTCSCTLFCSQLMATIHTRMFSEMEKAIFHSAICAQYGYSGKLRKTE